jgi:methyl-accepting chemotaxis protein
MFRRSSSESAALKVEPNAEAPSPALEATDTNDADSARQILELLELELGGMIRQLERAASSVAGGAEASAATLSTIRQRTDALTGRTSAAQSTAASFSQAADKFTHSLAVQTQEATEEIKKKIDALQRDAAGSVEAVHRISQAIQAIRPVFENVNGAVAEQNQTTTEMSNNVATASNFIASVGNSAAEIESAAREAATHGEHVANAGKAVTVFAEKLKARCAVLLGQDAQAERRKRDRLPCDLKIEIQTAQGAVSAAVYEISLESILIGGPAADALALHQSFNGVIETIGACRIRNCERSKAGVQAIFETMNAALAGKIEDRLWSIHDDNIEFVTRAMEAGAALTRIFEGAVASGAISIDDMFDTDYVEIPGSNPLQHRTRILDWADHALPPFQEAFLARDPRMVFCAMIDRNGYLPVHNKIYSHPQRPGEVAWNTAHSRNRRIFNDAAGLAAGQNQRSYLIQSYARDMGNGKTVMMREIDVPVRVNGRHWGGFRTAYKL